VDLSENARAVVLGFRLAEDAQANASLVSLIDALASALTRAPLLPHNARVLPVLQEILDAQMRGDTLRIADLVEYELLPVLGLAKT
jgi:hypothetical protein